MFGSLLARKATFVGFKARMYHSNRDITSSPVTIAPLLSLSMFQKVFSDKLVMKHLLNSVISLSSGKFKRILTVHNIEVSNASTTASLEPCEHTILFDSCCTFADGSMGCFKLIRTNDFSNNSLRDAVDCARMDYWNQWRENKEFRYPVQVAVIDFCPWTNRSFSFNPTKDYASIDIRHACPGLYHHPPRVEIATCNVFDGPETLAECTNDLQRWIVFLRDASLFDASDPPDILKCQTFRRAVEMLDVRAMPLSERCSLVFQLAHMAKLREIREAQRKIDVIDNLFVTIDMDAPDK